MTNTWLQGNELWHIATVFDTQHRTPQALIGKIPVGFGKGSKCLKHQWVIYKPNIYIYICICVYKNTYVYIYIYICIYIYAIYKHGEITHHLPTIDPNFQPDIQVVEKVFKRKQEIDGLAIPETNSSPLKVGRAPYGNESSSNGIHFQVLLLLVSGRLEVTKTVKCVL